MLDYQLKLESIMNNPYEKLHAVAPGLQEKIQTLVKEYPEFSFVISITDDTQDFPATMLMGDGCPVCMAHYITLLHQAGVISHLRVEGKNTETGHAQLTVHPEKDETEH